MHAMHAVVHLGKRLLRNCGGAQCENYDNG